MSDANTLLVEDLSRMTPTATTLSALLHGLVALALITELPRFAGAASDTAIEITIDLSSPPLETPVPVDAPPQAVVEPPPIEPDMVTAEPPDPPLPLMAEPSDPAPPQPPTIAAEAAAEPPLPAEPDRQEAAVVQVTPAAEPRLEQALPPVETAPPQIETREFAKAAPAPAPKAAKPRPAAQPTLPAAHAANPVPQAPSLAATNEAVQRKAQEDYLWQVIRKLSQYRYSSTSRDDPERGLVVTRVTVSHDGRLLDVSLAKSSGSVNLDRGIMDAIRRASPFAPLPADIGRDPYVFILPVNYVHER